MSETMREILNHLWESSLFGVGRVLLILALGKSWSVSRHLLAWASLLKFLIPFAWIGEVIGFVKSLFVASDDSVTVMIPLVNAFSDTLRIDTWIDIGLAAGDSRSAIPWTAITLFVWIIGLAVAGHLWIRQYRSVRRSIDSNCHDACEDWQELARRIWDSRRDRPEILVGRDNSLSAGVFGFLRPVVIVPESFTQSFSDCEREAFLRHEFQHIYRYDNIWLFVQKIVRNIFWFHPLVWWLDRQISAEREIMRDEEVIRKTRNITSYINCLMKASNIKLPSSYATSVGIKGSPFARRVKSIGRIKSSRLADKLSVVASVGAIIVMGIFLSSMSVSDLQALEDDDRRDRMTEDAMRDLEAEMMESEHKLQSLAREVEELGRSIEKRRSKNIEVPMDELDRFAQAKELLMASKERLHKQARPSRRAARVAVAGARDASDAGNEACS